MSPDGQTLAPNLYAAEPIPEAALSAAYAAIEMRRNEALYREPIPPDLWSELKAEGFPETRVDVAMFSPSAVTNQIKSALAITSLPI